nr:protein kinase [Propionibacterium sp.]
MPAADTRLADRYRLVEAVGAGAAGQVWRAVDERLRREVAVKTVDLAVHHGDPGIVARFQREVQTSAALTSPYIAAIYDSGQDEQTAYMVMELLSGPSLAALVDADGPLDWAKGLGFATDIASGLADAHAAGVIHRDLKPGNVVLHGGVAKIVDFGIARATDTSDRTMTSPETVTGTAAYMSPEQATGREVTPATDLYSLGCLLFTLFTGRPPFTAGTALATAGAHVHDAAPRLRDARPDAPAAVDALVTQLLSKDAAERPDARTTARALARLRDTVRRTGDPGDAEVTAPMPPITGRQPPVTAVLPPTALPPQPVLPTPTPSLTPRTAVMPAVEAIPHPTTGTASDRGVPVQTERRRRRPGSWLPWLVTLVLALALAAVAWVGLGQPNPLAPTKPAATPAPVPTATRTTAPTITLPIVVPTQPTTTAAPTPTPTTTAPSPTPAPTTTAPAPTPTAEPSP